MSLHKTTALSGLLFTLLAFPLAAHCDDPPLRVGRISYAEGTVSFHTADNPTWAYATLNYPVLSGSALWTEPNARSEVQIGSVEIRLDHLTEMQVLQLDEQTTRLAVPQGVVNIHFSTPPLSGAVEVVTPLGPIELTHPGTYHIDSGQPTADAPSGQVQLTTLEGEMDVAGERSRLEVLPGETAILTGNPPTYALQEGNATPFDDWALARERREEAHYAARYVSPHTTGYEDLDHYGQWTSEPGYGAVWYPAAVAGDWAPYRDGHWAYVAPWGWTWVDNAPWGFAPFHYGRWAYMHERWGWIPGEVVERPVYAPALVAFIGGGGWNPAFGNRGSSPAVGWVPLGPREVFRPYYPTSEHYLRNVNIANVNRTQINSVTYNNIRNVNAVNYVNRQAATVVPAPAFQQGRPVQGNKVQVSPQELAQAPLAQALAHVPPGPAAREEGHALPASAQSPAMPMNRMTVIHAPQSPEAPHAPYVAPVRPEASRETQAPASTAEDARRRASPLISYNEKAAQERRQAEAGHAPGPQIRAIVNPPAPATRHETAPQAQTAHPEQHSHIAPTHQGWQRMDEHPQDLHGGQKPKAHPDNNERHSDGEHRS